jgi:hypothetical protein
MGNLFLPSHLIVLSIVAIPLMVIPLIPFWIIFKKAGFQPILSVLMLVPLVNLITLYVVAFSQWKSTPAAGL